MQADGGAFGAAAASMMAVMARLFGWRPDEFWNATPEEVAGLLQGMTAAVDAQPAGGVARAQLQQMMEAFPDA
jgi:hypothetical protein